MATGKQAKGQGKVSFQLSDSEKERLASLAARSGGISMSKYIRNILRDALFQGVVYETKPIATFNKDVPNGVKKKRSKAG